MMNHNRRHLPSSRRAQTLILSRERVDEAMIGKEIYSLYSGEGASVLQRQAESRLFFSNLKNLLICILLVVVLIVLCKKGFDF